MQIVIDHTTTYAYDRAARYIVQTLKLTPRSTEAQQVRRWAIETNIDARLRRSEDAFGNITHALYTEQPTDILTIRVTGEVITTETHGVIPATGERLAPLVYLRTTPLTEPDKLIRVFATEFSAHPPLDRMHRLMASIHGSVKFEVGVTTPTHTAAEVLALGSGVCQDHAHLFISCARLMGVPARYVSGHLLRRDRADQEAAHAWAEVWIEDLGWVGFDPANGVCPDERYVRVAVGPDYLAAAPVRGASYGGAGERLSVSLKVRDADMQQGQQQA